jgi:hypothetical protein
MSINLKHKLRSKKAVALIASLATAGGLTTGALALSLNAHAQTAPSPSSPTQTQGPTPPTTAPLTENGGTSESSGTQGTSTSGNRITNVNSNLALTSARVVRENLNDTEASYVQFEFGYPVNTIKSTNGFVLQGYDVAATVSSDNARLVQGDPNGVLAEYPAGTDVARFTLASVNNGIVQDSTGEANIPSAAALGGSNLLGSQATDAPTLTSVRTIPTLEQVEYSFSQNIDRKGGGNTADLGFYTLDGRAITASSAITAVDNKVTMQFPGQVEHGALFFAKAGAVKDARGVQNIDTSVGRSTTAPNLVSVSSLVGKTQFDYTFDRPVSSVTANQFSVYDSSGKQYKGQSAVLPSADVVRVAFPEIQKYGAQITEASVSDGAAHSNDGSNAPSTLGSKAIGSANIANGKTSGPDLTSVAIDNSSGQVRYTFDRVIDDNKIFDPAKFAVVTQSGDIVPGRGFVEVDGNTVLVTFDQPVAAAASSATVSGGAVQDFQGQNNPIGRVAA